MGKKSKKNPHKHAVPQELLVQRSELRRSGASGVHADQKTRVLGIAATNRVGSRKSSTRVAVNDSLRSNSRGEFFVPENFLNPTRARLRTVRGLPPAMTYRTSCLHGSERA